MANLGSNGGFWRGVWDPIGVGCNLGFGREGGIWEGLSVKSVRPFSSFTAAEELMTSKPESKRVTSSPPESETSPIDTESDTDTSPFGDRPSSIDSSTKWGADLSEWGAEKILRRTAEVRSSSVETKGKQSQRRFAIKHKSNENRRWSKGEEVREESCFCMVVVVVWGLLLLLLLLFLQYIYAFCSYKTHTA